MLFIVVSMLAILAVAGLVVLYVAYPHRGEKVPGAAWAGHLLSRGVDKLPTVEELDEPLLPAPDLRRR